MKPLGEVELHENGSGQTIKKVCQDPFIPLSTEQLEKALEILKNRMPKSAAGYNMALMALRFPDANIRAYSFNGDISEKAIFMLIRNRQDWGQDIVLSNPDDFKETVEVRQAFSHTAAINWEQAYMFCAIDRLISPMILSISTIDKHNGTINNPNYYYYMSAEDAAKLEIEEKPGVVATSLDTEAGLEFIVDGWKYKKEGTREYTKEVLQKGVSAGVYVDGIPTAAVIVNWNGFLGMLFSGKEYRGKGYAKLCTQYVMKQLGTNGYAVASAVEYHNKASNKFHESVGLLKSHICDYVFYTPFKAVD